MKVYASTDFKGHYPVGTAAVVVAPNQRAARKWLIETAKKDHDLDLSNDDFSLEEIDPTTPGCYVLCDGNY